MMMGKDKAVKTKLQCVALIELAVLTLKAVFRSARYSVLARFSNMRMRKECSGYAVIDLLD